MEREDSQITVIDEPNEDVLTEAVEESSIKPQTTELASETTIVVNAPASVEPGIPVYSWKEKRLASQVVPKRYHITNPETADKLVKKLKR
jgi:hypothetical protein